MPAYQMSFKDGPAAEHSPVVVTQFPWPLPEFVMFWGVKGGVARLAKCGPEQHPVQGTVVYRKTSTEIIGAVRGWEYREVARA